MFSGSVGTKQNQTERLWQKPEPNHDQIFLEIQNQTQPKPNQTQQNWNHSQLYFISKKRKICPLMPHNEDRLTICCRSIFVYGYRFGDFFIDKTPKLQN